MGRRLLIKRLAGIWGPDRAAAPLKELGLRAVRCERVGAGGRLATFVVTARPDRGGEDARYVVKRKGTKEDLARSLGTKLQDMLDAEWDMTRLMSDAGLGPAGIARGRDWIVREYWAGTPLTEVLRRANEADIESILTGVFKALRRALEAVRAKNLLCYIDFNCENVLQRPDGSFYLVDHEWSVLKYRSYEEMERVTVASFFCKLLSLLPGDWSDARLFGHMAASGFPQWAGEPIRDRVALAYFSLGDVRLLEKLRASKDVKRHLVTAAVAGTTREALRQLCEELENRGIRWRFEGARDRHRSAVDDRDEDILLCVHPGDVMSITDAAFSLGFATCAQNHYIRYCAGSQQYLSILVEYRDPTGVGDLIARDSVRHPRGGDWLRGLAPGGLAGLRRLLARSGTRIVAFIGPEGAPEIAMLRAAADLLRRRGIRIELRQSTEQQERGGLSGRGAVLVKMRDWIEIWPGLPAQVTMQKLLILCLATPPRFSLPGLIQAAIAYLARLGAPKGRSPLPNQPLQGNHHGSE